ACDAVQHVRPDTPINRFPRTGMAAADSPNGPWIAGEAGGQNPGSAVGGWSGNEPSSLPDDTLWGIAADGAEMLAQGTEGVLGALTDEERRLALLAGIERLQRRRHLLDRRRTHRAQHAAQRVDRSGETRPVALGDGLPEHRHLAGGLPGEQSADLIEE